MPVCAGNRRIRDFPFFEVSGGVVGKEKGVFIIIYLPEDRAGTIVVDAGLVVYRAFLSSLRTSPLTLMMDREGGLCGSPYWLGCRQERP